MLIWNYDNNAKRIDSILFASFVIILITCSRKFPFSGDTDVTQAIGISETVGWDIWNVDKFKMFWIHNFLDSRSKVTISIFLKSDCELAKLFASSSEKTFWFSQPLIFWGKLLASFCAQQSIEQKIRGIEHSKHLWQCCKAEESRVLCKIFSSAQTCVQHFSAFLDFSAETTIQTIIGWGLKLLPQFADGLSE